MSTSTTRAGVRRGLGRVDGPDRPKRSVRWTGWPGLGTSATRLRADASADCRAIAPDLGLWVSPTQRRGVDAARPVLVAGSPLRRRPPADWRPRRLLVVRACCLGDALLATPVIASLAVAYPGVAIDVAIGAWSAPAVAGHPGVRRVIDIGSLIGGQRPALRELVGLAARLRRAGYDGAFVLERSRWLGALPALAGIPVRVGLDSGGRGFAHSVAVGTVGVRHEAERNLDLLRAIGIAPTAERMSFHPSQLDRDAAGRALTAAGWAGEPYALIHPGGGTNPGMRLPTKRWPAERFAAIAGRLAGRGLRVALVWGRGEQRLAAPIIGQVPDILRLGDDLSLGALGAAAGGASLYLGNDSGPTHLAVAMAVPTVALFGPSDERRFGPWGRIGGTPIGEAIAAPLLAPDDPSGPWLDRPVDAVSVDAVWDAVERARARAGSAQLRWR